MARVNRKGRRSTRTANDRPDRVVKSSRHAANVAREPESPGHGIGQTARRVSTRSLRPTASGLRAPCSPADTAIEAVFWVPRLKPRNYSRFPMALELFFCLPEQNPTEFYHRPAPQLLDPFLTHREFFRNIEERRSQASACEQPATPRPRATRTPREAQRAPRFQSERAVGRHGAGMDWDKPSTISTGGPPGDELDQGGTGCPAFSSSLTLSMTSTGSWEDSTLAAVSDVDPSS